MEEGNKVTTKSKISFVAFDTFSPANATGFQNSRLSKLSGNPHPHPPFLPQDLTTLLPLHRDELLSRVNEARSGREHSGTATDVVFTLRSAPLVFIGHVEDPVNSLHVAKRVQS